MKERFESRNIRSAAQLFKNMRNSGLSAPISSKLYYHEKAHADADEERRGEFGFIRTGGWIVAYYMIHGDRTPEQMMKIASAPGFDQMSNKDWEIYNYAWGEWKRKLAEEGFEPVNRELPDTYSKLRDKLTELVANNLDSQEGDKKLPAIRELLDYDFDQLMREFGPLIYKAYNEAVEQLRDLLSGGEQEESDKIGESTGN